MALTYSLVYTPLVKDWEYNHPKYTCSDNKIHIRFKDYNSPQLIEGFEAKLTYLISYLMNYCYLPKILNKSDNKSLMEDFLKTSDINKINVVIKEFTGDGKYKGLKLHKNYNKKTNIKYFGEVNIECFPIEEENGIEKASNLSLFLSNLGEIPLVSYLFNDNYKLYIHESKPKKTNKFLRKQLRKEQVVAQSELIELW